MNPAVLQFHSSCLKLFLSAWLGSDKEPGQKLSEGSSPAPFLGLDVPQHPCLWLLPPIPHLMGSLCCLDSGGTGGGWRCCGAALVCL